MGAQIHADLVELDVIRDELLDTVCELGLTHDAVLVHFGQLAFGEDLQSRWEEVEETFDRSFQETITKVDQRVDDWIEFDDKVMSAICAGPEPVRQRWHEDPLKMPWQVSRLDKVSDGLPKIASLLRQPRILVQEDKERWKDKKNSRLRRKRHAIFKAASSRHVHGHELD